ncbi:MAG TPA: hypothetical protein VMF13_11290 [Luteitalea sp.]|nr:hypothetical protein [Luteitalea sp.]
MNRRAMTEPADGEQRVCTYTKEGHTAVLFQRVTDGLAQLRIEVEGSAQFTMSGAPERLTAQVARLRQRMLGSGWVEA